MRAGGHIWRGRQCRGVGLLASLQGGLGGAWLPENARNAWERSGRGPAGDRMSGCTGAHTARPTDDVVT